MTFEVANPNINLHLPRLNCGGFRFSRSIDASEDPVNFLLFLEIKSGEVLVGKGLALGSSEKNRSSLWSIYLKNLSHSMPFQSHPMRLIHLGPWFNWSSKKTHECSSRKIYLVVSTHLKNMLVKLDHLPRWGGNKTCLSCHHLENERFCLCSV